MSITFTRGELRWTGAVACAFGVVFGALIGAVLITAVEDRHARERGEKPKTHVLLLGHSCECVKP